MNKQVVQQPEGNEREGRGVLIATRVILLIVMICGFWNAVSGTADTYAHRVAQMLVSVGVGIACILLYIKVGEWLGPEDSDQR